MHMMTFLSNLTMMIALNMHMKKMTIMIVTKLVKEKLNAQLDKWKKNQNHVMEPVMIIAKHLQKMMAPSPVIMLTSVTTTINGTHSSCVETFV